MWTNGQEVHLETGSKKISAAEVREKKEKNNYYIKQRLLVYFLDHICECMSLEEGG